MTLDQIKKRFNLSNADISKMFGYKNPHSYITSKAKKRIDTGITKLINYVVDDMTTQSDN